MEKNDDSNVVLSVVVGLVLFLDWYIINYQWEPLMTAARKDCIAKEAAYLTRLTGGNQHHHLGSFPSDLPFRLISMFKLTSIYKEKTITFIAESSIREDIPIRRIFVLTTPENKLIIVVEYSPLHITSTDIKTYLSSKFKELDGNSKIELDRTERVDDDNMLFVHINRLVITDTDGKLSHDTCPLFPFQLYIPVTNRFIFALFALSLSVDTSLAPLQQMIDSDPTQSQSLPQDQQADFNSVDDANGGVSNTSSPTQVQKYPFDDNLDIGGIDGIDDVSKDIFELFMRNMHIDDENKTSIPVLSTFSGFDEFIDEFVANNNITASPGDHKHFFKCIQEEFDGLEKRYESANDHSELNRDVYHLVNLLVLFVDAVIRKNIDVVELLTDDISNAAIYKNAFDILESDKIANHLLILNNDPGYFYSLSDILGYNLLNIMIECEEQVQKVDGQGTFCFSHVLHFIVLIIGNQKCLIRKQNSVGVDALVADDRYNKDYTKFKCYVFKLTSLHLLSRMVELQERPPNNSQAAGNKTKGAM